MWKNNGILKYKHLIFEWAVLIWAKLGPISSRLFKIPPLRITLYLTNKCNLTCSHCFQKEELNTKLPDELNRDEWLKIIRNIPRTTIIDFVGGEILLHPNIKEFLELTHKKKQVVSFTTNATKLSPEVIGWLFDYKVNYLMISIDGMEKFHDTYRGRDGLFSYIMNSIRYMDDLASKKPIPFSIAIKTTILDRNIDDIIPLIKTFSGISIVNEIKFHFSVQKKYLHNILTHDNLDEVLADDNNEFKYLDESLLKFKSILPELIKVIAKSDINVSFSPSLERFEEYLDFMSTPKSFQISSKCNIPNSHLTIQPDGGMTPCLSYSIGNIRDFNYDARSVLFSERHKYFLTRLNKKNQHDGCRHCVLKEHSLINLP